MIFIPELKTQLENVSCKMPLSPAPANQNTLQNTHYLRHLYHQDRLFFQKQLFFYHRSPLLLKISPLFKTVHVQSLASPKAQPFISFFLFNSNTYQRFY